MKITPMQMHLSASVVYEELGTVLDGASCYFAEETIVEEGVETVYYYIIVPYTDPRDSNYVDFLNLYFYSDPNELSEDELYQLACDILGE